MGRTWVESWAVFTTVAFLLVTLPRVRARDLVSSGVLSPQRFQAASPLQPQPQDTLAMLRAQLQEAGVQLLALAPRDREQPPVMCGCPGFCAGLCFAAGCAPCAPSTWTTEQDCLNPGPLGGGLLCQAYTNGTASGAPCCAPQGGGLPGLPQPCQLSGPLAGQWCDCAHQPPPPSYDPPLFPPLDRRSFEDGKCLSKQPS